MTVEDVQGNKDICILEVYVQGKIKLFWFYQDKDFLKPHKIITQWRYPTNLLRHYEKDTPKDLSLH